jgi:hypothetical protein
VTDPASTAEPAETVNQAKAVEDGETEDAGAVIQALGETVAKAVGEMVRAELDLRDKRMAALEQQIQSLGRSVEEKVEQRLANLPPVVKVAPSQVASTAAPVQPKGLTFGSAPEAEKFVTTLVADIRRVVEDQMAGAQVKV